MPRALDQIDQFVVVMMENRSFDHMLGYWGLPPWSADRAAQPADGVRLDHVCPAPDGSPRRPFAFTAEELGRIDHDLPHDRRSVWGQLNRDAANPTRFHMDGFVRQSVPAGPVPEHVPCLGYLTPSLVPVTHFLSTEFTICDRWFSPIPTETHPNRMMSLAGWTPYDQTPGQLVDASPTVVDFLRGRGVDLRVYARRVSFLALATSTVTHAREVLHPWASFEAEWNAPVTGPRVVYAEPAYRDAGSIVPQPPAEDDHPPTPVAYGQAFLREVYRIVRGNDERWRRTLMIITYDEHGGFADHVSPPILETPAPAQGLYPRFVSAGPRVPAILVSPWVDRLGTCKLVLDHTSILRTLAEKFAPGNQRVFRNADGGAADCVFRRPVSSLWPALTRTTPRDDNPPSPPAPALPPQPASAPNPATPVIQAALDAVLARLGVLP